MRWAGDYELYIMIAKVTVMLYFRALTLNMPIILIGS